MNPINRPVLLDLTQDSIQDLEVEDDVGWMNSLYAEPPASGDLARRYGCSRLMFHGLRSPVAPSARHSASARRRWDGNLVKTVLLDRLGGRIWVGGVVLKGRRLAGLMKSNRYGRGRTKGLRTIGQEQARGR